MNNSLRRTLFVISLFTIAMGMLESAVVIYLRDILYPEGFEFPHRQVEKTKAPQYQAVKRSFVVGVRLLSLRLRGLHWDALQAKSLGSLLSPGIFHSTPLQERVLDGFEMKKPGTSYQAFLCSGGS